MTRLALQAIFKAGCFLSRLAVFLCLASPAQAFLIDDPNAKYVLGQSNFTATSANQGGSAGQSTLSAPRGLACDTANSRLFVADTGNNRVMVFSTSGIASGENASNVLGQSSFSASSSNKGGSASQSSLSQPYDVSYDALTNLLYVADPGNTRVMVFFVGTGLISNGENASYVLGQSNFTGTTASLSQSGMDTPRGVAVDNVNQRVFASDDSYNRVMAFNTAPTNGLVGWWRFDEGSGTSASDSSGSSNTGTLKQAPTWVAGQIGDALSLNGTNQYVDVANPSNFNFSNTDSFTLALWINRSSSSSVDDELVDKVSQTNSHGFSEWMATMALPTPPVITC